MSIANPPGDLASTATGGRSLAENLVAWKQLLLPLGAISTVFVMLVPMPAFAMDLLLACRSPPPLSSS